MMCVDKDKLKDGQVVRIHLNDGASGLGIIRSVNPNPYSPKEDDNVSVIFVEEVPDSVIKLGVSYLVNVTQIERL